MKIARRESLGINVNYGIDQESYIEYLKKGMQKSLAKEVFEKLSSDSREYVIEWKPLKRVKLRDQLHLMLAVELSLLDADSAEVGEHVYPAYYKMQYPFKMKVGRKEFERDGAVWVRVK